MWDLPTVLRDLKGPPFGALQSVDLRSLWRKTALLLVLASVKRMVELQVLSGHALEMGALDKGDMQNVEVGIHIQGWYTSTLPSLNLSSARQ